MSIQKLPHEILKKIVNYLTISQYRCIIQSGCKLLTELCEKRLQIVENVFDLNVNRIHKFCEFDTEQLCGIPAKDEYDEALLQHSITNREIVCCFVVFPIEFSWELAIYVLWKRMLFDIQKADIQLIFWNKIPLAMGITEFLGDKLHFDTHRYNMIPVTCPLWANSMVFTFAEELRLIYANDFVLHYLVLDKLINGSVNEHLLLEKSKLNSFSEYFYICKPLEVSHRDWTPIILPRVDNLQALLQCLGLPVSDQLSLSTWSNFDRNIHLNHFVQEMPHNNSIEEFADSLLACYFAVISDVPFTIGGNRSYFMIGHSHSNSQYSIGFAACSFVDE